MTSEEKRQIINIVHETIYSFFDVCNDELSDKDKLLLLVNKAICSNIKSLEQTRFCPNCGTKMEKEE